MKLVHQLKTIKIFFSFLSLFLSTAVFAQEYKIVTVVESVVPGGLGSSKILVTGADGTTSMNGLKNFFSMAGINFDNIENNDQQIHKVLTDLESQGYQFLSVNSGVYSANESSGIFVTRFIYRKSAQE